MWIWLLNAECHVDMDYHSNYNRLLMEKHYPCSESAKLCKNILVLSDVVSGLSGSATLSERDHSSFRYWCETWKLKLLLLLRVPVSLDVWCLSAKPACLKWPYFTFMACCITGSTNQSWTLKMVWDCNAAKGRNSLPKYHHRFRKSLLIQNFLEATRLENCSACCSSQLRTEKHWMNSWAASVQVA